jgi:crotonobetainyl-CoA:carnitine CoA-transferase CaiB-like acyl-CoA transferase
MTEQTQAAGPLDGVRVLDLSSVVLGPLATQIMGDLGADVIKIEAPEGDTTRYTGPARSADMAALFMGVNRNKRSLVLDLKQPAACDALWRLIDGADVFIHSIRPQKIARLGFSHDAVLARNRRMIYAGLHGYLSGGPYAGRPAYDDVIQGQSGSAALMALLVDEPRYMPTIMADKTCAMTAAYAVMAALFQRERTGRGQFVEIPMFESMVAFNMIEHLYGHTFEPPEGPMGYTRVLSPWRRPYATSDGHICMMVYTDDQWRRFWRHVGKPELAADPRFDTLSRRSENITELYRIAGECVAGRTTGHWVEILAGLDIPAAPMAALEDLAADAQLDAVGFFRKIDHPTEGRIVMPDSPVRFDGTSPALQRLQPKLGEHSVEVLREAGLTGAEIARLVAARASLDGKVEKS